MTKSTITRERLQEIAEDGFLKHGESKELARIALAAMDSEPVFTLEVERADYKGQKLGNHFGFITLDAARKLEEGNYQLYRHAQQSVVPVSYKEPISFDDWSRKCALQVTLCYSDFREKAQYIWDSARETMHVAPVAMPECFSNAVSALESLYRNGQKQGWNERYTTDMAYASGVLNACRAAMLAAAPQSPGSEPATVPGTWIPVSERIPDNTEPVLCIEKRADFGTYGQPFVCWHDGGGWVGKTNYRPIVTHWMPLPAAPREVQGE